MKKGAETIGDGELHLQRLPWCLEHSTGLTCPHSHIPNGLAPANSVCENIKRGNGMSAANRTEKALQREGRFKRDRRRTNGRVREG